MAFGFVLRLLQMEGKIILSFYASHLFVFFSSFFNWSVVFLATETISCTLSVEKMQSGYCAWLRRPMPILAVLTMTLRGINATPFFFFLVLCRPVTLFFLHVQLSRGDRADHAIDDVHLKWNHWSFWGDKKEEFLTSTTVGGEPCKCVGDSFLDRR